jgi:hypothetical protein
VRPPKELAAQTPLPVNILRKCWQLTEFPDSPLVIFPPLQGDAQPTLCPQAVFAWFARKGRTTIMKMFTWKPPSKTGR